jgi:hypothetical protein
MSQLNRHKHHHCIWFRENEHVAPGNDVGLADDQLDVLYSQPVKKKKVAAVCDDVYAKVDKTSKRTHVVKCSATEGKVLQYINITFRQNNFIYNSVNILNKLEFIFWNIIIFI